MESHTEAQGGAKTHSSSCRAGTEPEQESCASATSPESDLDSDSFLNPKVGAEGSRGQQSRSRFLGSRPSLGVLGRPPSSCVLTLPFPLGRLEANGEESATCVEEGEG